MEFMFWLYFVCFGVGLLFTLISAFLADAFGGHDVHVDGAGADGHAEAGFGSHDMPGFSPLSPTTIAAFVTAFGGLGMVFTKISITSTPWISAPLALLGGLAIAAAVFLMFQQVFRRTQSSSESHVSDLIGQSATIITTIPSQGVGEIAYIQSGSRYTAPARTEDGAPLSHGEPVVITRLAGTQFFVTRI